MNQSRSIPGLLAALGLTLLAVALFAPMASGAPAPGYEQFTGCPTPAEADLEYCIRSDITGGHLQMGKKNVPIENPLKIVGAIDGSFQGFTAGPGGGLSKVAQKVPGGVIGLTGLTWLLEFFGSDALTLYATTELAAAPTNFVVSSVTIPIKVHLTTPSGVLGSSCYVGSNSSPITLNLTTGTTSPPEPNKPITGKEPEPGFDLEKEIITFSNGTYVDNSFAVPGANGCTLKLFGFIPISLNGFVNEQAGLPSAAGHNEAVQDFDIEVALQDDVFP